jgi:hypothetical protein
MPVVIGLPVPMIDVPPVLEPVGPLPAVPDPLPRPPPDPEAPPTPVLSAEPTHAAMIKELTAIATPLRRRSSRGAFIEKLVVRRDMA